MFKKLFKRNTYKLYKYIEGENGVHVATYKKRKVNDALIDHIASVVPYINENTLEIINRDDEKIMYRFVLDGRPNLYSLVLVR